MSLQPCWPHSQSKGRVESARQDSVQLNVCNRLASSEGLCRSSTEGQHLASALCVLQEVRPILHHLGSWPQVESVVVCGAHGITGSVCKLQFNMLVRVPLLMEDRRGQTTKAMSGHAALVVHAFQCFQDGVVAHGLPGAAVTEEKPFAAPGQVAQHLQHFQSLPG